MNKKRILILIASIIVLLSIIGVSFFFIKNKYNELEKLEINSSEKNNTKNNTSNNKAVKNEQEKEENDNSSTNVDKMFEEEIVNYFEDNYNGINSNAWDSVKDKAKEYFITIVDFIFYNGEIKGYTFNDLSSTTKLKIISIALKIDHKIEKHIPGYKDTISSNGSKIYNNVKERLVTLYLDISAEICKNHENDCDTAKEIFKDIKDNCRIGWDFVKKLVSSGTSKLKEWYEVYSGK